ncbi:GDYXXLXY domain-containing protein [Shewanella gelidii]|uniref:Membrane protein n=1 Tax=Shewanella gelidii TaxID=1642821 RepID=A0A917JX40_9GAMM|nr:GDYXXLXY domain-containing protein [Shewanella gelidii]MCL1098147.1 GDYXXLXY domain-containing protein [Shewanella gelidii]GGI90929.1 membrane protein [Shewanella gelidii]
MNRIIAIIALIFALGAINFSIMTRENHIRDGELVLIKLAPVDPRSLMQGDYMALRFEMADKIKTAHQLTEEALPNAVDGQVIVSVDNNQVAHFQRLSDTQPLNDDNKRINYRIRNSQVKFATNAFFFEEGQATLFEDAQYGGFKVNSKGELLLVAMYNEKFAKIIAKDIE